VKYLIYISYKYGFPIARPLQSEILLRGDQVAWFIELEENKRLLNENECLLNTIDDVILYNPDVVLATCNEVPHFFSGIKVQLFHGFSVNKRSKKKGHFRVRGFFDLYCTQGPSTTNEFEKIAKKQKHFAVIETGWSKVDVLFPVKKTENKKAVVFLASTFTESLSLAYDDLFYKEIVRLIQKNNWNWVINLHPKMKPEIVQKFKRLKKYLNVSYIESLDTLEPLKFADILITDTTSLITEFVIQHKPVVTYKNNVPQKFMLNITKPDALEEACKRAIKRPNDLMDEIKIFINKEHPYFDGESSKRVIDAVFQFYSSGALKKLKRKPLNLIRKFKIRRKLNYFKFW